MNTIRDVLVSFYNSLPLLVTLNPCALSGFRIHPEAFLNLSSNGCTTPGRKFDSETCSAQIKLHEYFMILLWYSSISRVIESHTYTDLALHKRSCGLSN